MGIDEYRKEYIECYNLVIDITQMIKNFFYPKKYTFLRIDGSLSLKYQMDLIRKDLESMRFEKEIASVFMENLEYYFYHGKYSQKDIEKYVDSIQLYFKPQLIKIKDRLEEKYLPFIKAVEIADFKDTNSGKYTDEQVWKLVLSDNESVKNTENNLEDIIGVLMNNSNTNAADKLLRKYYQLQEIEFNRFMNGINNTHSSIIKSEDHKSKIDVDFKLFNNIFGDIFGQDEAIEKIRKTLLRNILFYNAEDILENKTKSQGPLATFMFYGPTGTGKTETAKKMAKFVYGTDKKMLILDMNSYKDPKVSANAIKGLPEGYVDSAKGTDFTRFLTNNDKGIIVLDEFEKASNEVRELFMTMLDEGTFKDSLGNWYDLSGYIFVATTNVSEVFEHKPKKIGFGAVDEKQENKNEESRIRDELRRIFTAPIINRFNNVVGFKTISRADATLICKDLINKMIGKFESKRFGDICPHIEIDNIDEIVEIILEESNFKKDGVRSLKNVINDLIGSQILEEIVSENGEIFVSSKNDEITIGKMPKGLHILRRK